jgi:hypothetical protein
VSDKTLYVVFGNPPSPEQDGEFNEWYEGTHIPEVLQVPGIISAQRYKVSPLDGAPGAPKFSYLTIYEVEGDPNEVMGKIGAGVASGAIRMDGAPLDPATLSMAFWTPVTEKIESLSERTIHLLPGRRARPCPPTAALCA